MKFYNIKMRDTKIGEKYLDVHKQDGKTIIDLEVNFKYVEQKSKIILDETLRINNMDLRLIDNGQKSSFQYDMMQNKTIYSHNKFYTDELLIMYILGINKGQQQYYETLNSYTYDYYKTRVLYKDSKRCNIMLPVYAYLEYEEDGCLEYYEDMLQELTMESM